MAPPNARPDPERTPERVYASWRAQRDAGDAPDFDSMCSDHPGIAARLRALHSRHERAGASLLRSDVRTAHANAGPFDDVLDRLRRHRPAESRYRDVEALNQGGMGQLLRVEDLDLRRTVAKKIIRPRGGTPAEQAEHDPEKLGRFLEEAQVTAQLSHPGIVPVHDLGIDESGRVFFTMDLVSGQTLAEVFELARANEGGWSTTRAAGLLLRVCETLAYAHSIGVVHRDLKPANVMVGAFGEVYVIDWGLAKLIGDTRRDASRGTTSARIASDRRDASDRDVLAAALTEDGTAAGTPGFMAPEQAGGRIDAIDARTDVYAIGALLYSLLTGRRPFSERLAEGLGRRPMHADMLSYVRAVEAGEFTPIETVAPDAPAELVSIARRAMATMPEERYPSAEEMREDLARFLDGRVVRAHERGAWAELRKWIGRNRALASALGAAVVAAIGAAVGIAWFERAGRLGVQSEQRNSEISRSPTQFAGLVRRADEIWPSDPDHVVALERWFSDVEQLRALRPQIAAALGAFDGRNSSYTVEGLLGTARATAPNAADHRADLRRDLLDLDTALESSQLPTEWVRARLEIARTLEERSVTGPLAISRWNEARASIGSLAEYGALDLPVQLGLLPLRRDPVSGLWEFAHLLTGEPPELDATDRWRITGATGVVLVLIPGGTYSIGTPVVPTDDELYDNVQWSDDRPTPTPPFSVHLDAFFIAKHELTEGQRRRLENVARSAWKDLGGLRPADMISWDTATELAQRCDLTLPTEAQWEVAARGGGRFRFGPSGDAQTLESIAVITDFPGVENGPMPVGSREPNRFGLYDTLGNVWEWSRDTFDEGAAPRAGDGLRSDVTQGANAEKRVLRGGGYSGDWTNARVTHRFVWERQNREPDCGVRFARAIRAEHRP